MGLTYIRRKNDHPGGQGRIYTSNLNITGKNGGRVPPGGIMPRLHIQSEWKIRVRRL